MNRKPIKRSLFYNQKQLATLLSDGQALSVFRTTSATLATLSAHDSLATLHQVDVNGSILGRHSRQALSFSYTPYGYCDVPASSPLAYNSEFYDHVAGGYFLGQGYRLFSPSLMRLNAYDSYSPVTILNGYAYCVGNPIGHTDPSGHAPPGLIPKDRNLAAAFAYKWLAKTRLAKNDRIMQLVKRHVDEITDIDNQFDGLVTEEAKLQERIVFTEKRIQHHRYMQKHPESHGSSGSDMRAASRAANESRINKHVAQEELETYEAQLKHIKKKMSDLTDKFGERSVSLSEALLEELKESSKKLKEVRQS